MFANVTIFLFLILSFESIDGIGRAFIVGRIGVVLGNMTMNLIWLTDLFNSDCQCRVTHLIDQHLR